MLRAHQAIGGISDNIWLVSEAAFCVLIGLLTAPATHLLGYGSSDWLFSMPTCHLDTHYYIIRSEETTLIM